MLGDLINKLSINKITKKTFGAIVIIFLHFLNRTDEINMIIQGLLLTLVFVVGKMLFNYPHQIDLEHYLLKNSLGLISFITLLRKTSFISLPDSIIRSINSFISNTNTLAENFMDGVPVIDQNLNTTRNIDFGENVFGDNINQNLDPNPNPLEKVILKSVFEKIITTL